MPTCNRCQDKTEYDWYEDQYGKWKLGTKLDINNYRQHKCISQSFTKEGEDVKFPDRRGWFKFNCEKCGVYVMRSKKHFSSKDLKLCLECKEHERIL